jgi:hypothetical protein
MIKYVTIPERQETIAILNGTEFDAVFKIDKMLESIGASIYDYKKYLMPRTFKATVKCDPRDTYSEEEGRRRAKEKLMRNYHKSVDKRIAMFRNSMLELNGKVFENNLVKDLTD